MTDQEVEDVLALWEIDMLPQSAPKPRYDAVGTLPDLLRAIGERTQTEANGRSRRNRE